MTLIYVLMGLMSLWLAALTIAFLAVTKTAAVARLHTASPGGPLPFGSGFRLDEDGPEAGSQMPGFVRDLLISRGVQTDDVAIVMLSGNCGHCIERASELLEAPFNNEFFLAAGRAEHPGTQELLRILNTAGAAYVAGDEASDAADALAVHSVPFAILFRNGEVADKAYLRRALDFKELISRSVA